MKFHCTSRLERDTSLDPDKNMRYWNIFISSAILWNLLNSNETLRNLKNYHGISWFLLKFTEVLLESLEHQCNFVKSGEFEWTLEKFLKISWNIINFREISWHLWEFTEILSKSLKFQWNPMDSVLSSNKTVRIAWNS